MRPPAARVVYFIASHVNPDQVLRLARACLRGGSPGSRVLIHHDYNVSHLDRAAVERLGNVDLLEQSTRIVRGFFSMCRMVESSMRWLLDHRDFDWVVYLSGQDYPLQPPAEIESFLAATPYDGFLDALPVEQRDWVIGPQRYLYQYYRVPAFAGEAVRRAIAPRQRAARAAGRMPRLLIPQEPKHRGPRVGVRPFFGPFRDGFRCYMGSCWWTLNRRCVRQMIRDFDARPDLVRYYQRIQFAPNESFYLTLLCNRPELNLLTTDNKRFLRWTTPETSHPDTLVTDDFHALVSSGHHFGRKFDQAKDGRILDLLDAHMAEQAPATR
jgi:hypothetical protein